MAVTGYSTTPGSNNGSPPNGAPEGMAPSAVNDTIRQIMADVAVEAQVNAVKVLASVAGTDTITGSMTPDLTAYSSGMIVVFTPANNNTGAATLNIDSLGAKSIVKGDGAALVSGDLQASTAHVLVYDGTNFVVLNPRTADLVGLSVSGSATINGSLTTDNSTADEPGFKGLPANTQNANYTLVLTDAGKMILATSTGGFTWTIPANASVAFPVGTVVTFINDTLGTNTIAITTDTLRLSGTSSTGSRTLASIGIATAVKVTSTEWVISGTGLS
jgi:hypothetical protein